MNGPSPPDTSAPTVLRAVFVCFLVSRLAVLGLLAILPPELFFSDVRIYADYAARSFHAGQTPYHGDFEIEYPALSFWVVLLPVLLTSASPATAWQRYLREYGLYFRAEMFLLDVAAFFFFIDWAHRRRSDLAVLAAVAYTVLGLLLAPVLYNRMDAGLLFCLMLWVWAFGRGSDAAGSVGETAGGVNRVEASARQTVGYLALAAAALGLAAAYKLVPIVAFPFFGVALLRLCPCLKSVLLLGIVLVVTAVGPFLVQQIVSGEDVWWFLEFHGKRGLEVESVYASLLMTLSPWLEVTAVGQRWSWDMGGPIAALIAAWSTWLLLAVLAVLGLVCLRSRDLKSGYLFALLSIAIATTLSKVLSAQYFVWLLSLMLVLGLEVCSTKGFVTLAALCCLIALLTSFVFPFNFMQVRSPSGEVYTPWALLQGLGPTRDFHPLTAGILGIRNALLLLTVAWLTWLVARRRHA